MLLANTRKQFGFPMLHQVTVFNVWLQASNSIHFEAAGTGLKLRG